MNSKQKGSGYEREVKEYLEAQGYSVFRVHRKPIFIAGRMLTKGADIFGCDLVAKKAYQKPLWIQVSTIENLSKKKKQVELYPWNVLHEQLEIWGRVKGKKVYRVFEACATLGSENEEEIIWREKEPVIIGSTGRGVQAPKAA